MPAPAAPFHLAIPVDDLDAAAAFYGTVLGCPRGREDTEWIDWDLRGHQLVTHRVRGHRPATAHNDVDGHRVPVPHFGLVLAVEEFHDLARRLLEAGTYFVIEPGIRFAGAPGEQWTMFFLDPAGNALEFKAFADPEQLFARQP